jgi:transcriptional regulator with XRE-family HTH domain
LHWTTVSRVETGKQSPTWDTVVSLATGLGVEISDLARLAAEASEADS